MIDELKTDYKDDVLATSQQGKRTFNIVGKNGEILFEDVHIEDTSRYLQVGDEYGQEIINEQNSAINQLSKGTGYVFDTYAEYLEAYQGGEIPNGSIVYIKEGSVNGTITALQVKYNDSNVKLALDTLDNRLNNIQPVCSGVTLPFTPPKNGFLIAFIRGTSSSSPIRSYVQLSNVTPGIIDGLTLGKSYIIQTVFVTKNSQISVSGSANVESSNYYYVAFE